jgi:ABC-type sugar transport system substrate-binding protein
MKTKMKKILLIAGIVVLAAVVMGCSGSKKAAPKKVYSIGYSSIASSIAPWANAMEQNIKKECDARGWTLTSLSAEGDMQLQTEQVHTLITKKPDVIVLFAGDNAVSVDWVKDIHAAGIPCVMVALNVNEEGRQYVNAFVGPDQEAMTKKIAETIVQKHGKDAGLLITCISGVPVQYDYIIRLKGFKEGIEGTNYKFVGPEYAYSSRADAQGFMETYISTYKDKINVLMGFDDDLTLGALKAIDEAGLTGKIEVYSVTGQVEALKAIKDGKMAMTVMNRTDLIAKKAAEVIEKIMAGEKIEYNQPTEVFYITKENVDQYQGEF